MATVPVEVKKSAPSPNAAPDVWRAFRSELDRLLDRFRVDMRWPSLDHLFESTPATGLTSSFTMPMPAVDITEEAEAFKVTAELPGLTEKEIEVAVNGSMLTLKGEKKQETEKADKGYHLSERAYGMFERSFTLPDTVDAEKIGAAFANGVLTVTLPLKPDVKAQTKKIEVKAAA